jgi:hypothetical protein
MIHKEHILKIGTGRDSINLYRLAEDDHVHFIIHSGETLPDDAAYHSANRYHTLEEAFLNIYLRFPLFSFQISYILPECILPFARVIKENKHLRNKQYDIKKADAEDREYMEKIQKITPDIWQLLASLARQAREAGLNEYGIEKHRISPIEASLPKEIFNLLQIYILCPLDLSDWDEGRWLLIVPGTDFNKLDLLTLCKIVSLAFQIGRKAKEPCSKPVNRDMIQEILDAIISKTVANK